MSEPCNEQNAHGWILSVIQDAITHMGEGSTTQGAVDYMLNEYKFENDESREWAVETMTELFDIFSQYTDFHNGDSDD